MAKTAINILIQAFWDMCFHFSWINICEWNCCVTGWMCDCTTYTSTSRVWVLVTPHLHQYLCSIFFILAICQWFALIFTSLMTNNVEHLLMCSLNIFTSFMKCFLSIFNWFVYNFCLVELEKLFIYSKFNFFCHLYKLFLPICGLPIYFFSRIFFTKFFSFDK